MPRMKGAELITEYLIENGIPYVFGICGHGNVGMLDPLYAARYRIKLVSPRHEQVAAHMADAYFRVRHEPVATLTGIWAQRTDSRRSRSARARRGDPRRIALSRSAATPSGDVAMHTGRGSTRRTAVSRRAENEVTQTRSQAAVRRSASARLVAPHTNGTVNCHLSTWWASSAGVSTSDSSM